MEPDTCRSPATVTRPVHPGVMWTLIALALLWSGGGAGAQVVADTAMRDSVTVRLVGADLRVTAQLLGRYLDRPVIVGAVPPGALVTVETPRPIPRAEVLPLLRGVLASHNVQVVFDSVARLYQLRAAPPAPPAAAAAFRPGGAAGSQLYVIRLRHARATDVASSVNALYGKATLIGELGETPAPLSRSLQQGQGGGVSPSEPRPMGGAGTGTFAGQVVIVPDPRANSLLIRASAADYALIEDAVRQVDVRPLQVLIEVLIAEVRKDRGLVFGMNVQVPETPVRNSRSLTADGSVAGASLGAQPGEMSIRVRGIGGIDVEATLRAAASRGDATIVSRPVIIAANNEKAEINVGSQRPFVQLSRVLPTENAARDQIVQYKDVGTRLAVVPTISAEGYVMLQVMQEINAATEEQQFNAPVISTRSVETRLLIRDGQTIVLGGLSDSQREASTIGIPLLSRIPLIGGLFGQARRRNSATELYLFITPRVIREDADADTLTRPLHGRAERMEP
jgi:general secretion pathway protein D